MAGATRSTNITKEKITAIINKYGFIECSKMQDFLFYICEENLSKSELNFLKSKTEECLSQHDNGTRWFAGLRHLLQTLTQATWNSPTDK